MNFLWPILNSVMMFLLIIFSIIVMFFIPIITFAILYFLYQYFFKGRRVPKSKVKGVKTKEPNLFKQLFYLFPRQFIDDLFNINPDSFPLHGMNLFCGSQGKGKTITLIHYARMLSRLHPNLKVYANLGVSFADGKITSIDDIISNNSKDEPNITILDEVQNWFNSAESRNFPVEMLQEVCQLRKQQCLMLMSAQVYSNVAHPIKQQTDYLFLPYTFLGCFTVVRLYKVTRDENGNITGQRLQKLYSFVQDAELRSCYDTWEKIERLNKKGYKPTDQQIRNVSFQVVNGEK